jgi:hypothetical protein
VALDLGMSLFEWSAVKGLSRSEDDAVYGNTTDPRRALLHLDSLEIEAVFWLKDMGAFLESAAISRLFREVAQHFANTSNCFVMTGIDLKLPADIEHALVRYDLKTPSAEELGTVLDTSIASLRTRYQFEMHLSDDERDTILRIHLQQRNQPPESFDIPALVVATEGFSGAEIEQAVIGALYRALYAQQAPTPELMLDEITNTVPLPRTRAEDLAKLRAEAAGRFVPVHSVGTQL